jgi:hypothetical protein
MANPTPEELIVSCLQAAIPGVMVRPDIAEASDAPPYVVYSQVSCQNVTSLLGDSGLSNPLIQIDAYARTKPEVVALKNAIYDAIMASPALAATPRSDASGFEPEPKLYRHRQDFSCWVYT